ncbi:hypothetical protein PanWU01x14_162410 [Parasponia andersonii]|uniref:Uncharacterized protein n=1 Tax=Parasponia andersonii TaxID=3476 RepID=A0A2P5CDJ2_PARAD|nr:hypothetical protein PanWU01x14_162410 [Parasponia andersonii]
MEEANKRSRTYGTYSNLNRIGLTAGKCIITKNINT